MRTREEILDNWETEQYADWYAIDSYDPMDGTMHRLFVGNEDDAAKMMREYATPTDKAMQPFHRCALISTSEALAYFKGKETDIDERSEYTITEAAGILGLSRQRVHVLLRNGQLEGHKRGNSWFIYRYSVEKRLAIGKKMIVKDIAAMFGDSKTYRVFFDNEWHEASEFEIMNDSYYGSHSVKSWEVGKTDSHEIMVYCNDD